MLAACLEPVELGTRRVRLMFQDEARFGRMVRIRRCWAQKPERPVVCNGYEREFLYVYGAVSPLHVGAGLNLSSFSRSERACSS